MEAPSRAIALQHKTLVSFLFPFQALLLMGLITAAQTQVLGERKDRDSCESDDYANTDDLRKRRRCRGLDGLTVCLHATIVILFHDHVFVIDHKERRIRPE